MTDEEHPGPLCNCGRRGCLEQFISGPAKNRDRDREEQHPRKLFPQYAAYAVRVPSLIPVGSRWPATQPFRWELFRRNQEWRALAGYGFAVVLLLVKALFL